MSEKTWHRRKSDRPREIRAAARVEFSLKGFDAVTMAAIAARAGITKGTIYLYYRNKQELFDALGEELGATVGNLRCNY
jgi:AcrR family transcriptional regulator